AGQAQAPDVLQQQGAWPDDVDLLDRPGEEITLICCSELLAGNGERGARNSAGQEVDGGHTRPGGIVGWIPHVEISNIALCHLPFWAVVAQCIDRVLVQFDRELVLEASLLQAKG